MRRRLLAAVLCALLGGLYPWVAVMEQGGGGVGGATAVSDLTVTPSTTGAGATADYTIDFTTSASGALSAGEAIVLTFSPAVTLSAATYAVTAGGAVTVALLLPMGRLADRYGFRPFLVIGFALAGISAHFVGRSADGMGVLPLVLLLGASYATILPAWNGLMAGAVPEQVRATFMGLFMTVEGLGLALGPALGGAIWTVIGHRAPFDASSMVLVAMAAIYTFIPVERLASAGSRWEDSA